MPTITAKTIKATIILDAQSVLDVELRDGVARTVLTVRAPDRTLKVDLACKAIRKAQTTIREHGVDGTACLLQGKLIAGDVLAECGIVAQPKAKKPEAEPAQAA